MPDEHHLYVPWYEASPETLDEFALIERTVAQLRERQDAPR
jgi:hypothetical protein